MREIHELCSSPGTRKIQILHTNLNENTEKQAETIFMRQHLPSKIQYVPIVDDNKISPWKLSTSKKQIKDKYIIWKKYIPI